MSGPTALVGRRPATRSKRSEREYLRHGRISSPALVLWQLLSLDYPRSITATCRDYRHWPRVTVPVAAGMLDARAVRLPQPGPRQSPFPSKGGIISGGGVLLAEAIA